MLLEQIDNVAHILVVLWFEDFPHNIFKPNPKIKEKSDRASQANFKTLEINPLKKQNLANKLAKLALNWQKQTKKGIRQSKSLC